MIDKQKFPQTAQAVEEIGLALNAAKQALDKKKYAILQQKQAYKRNLSEKNAQLEIFSKTATEALNSVENAVCQIDMVLEKNGSGNNNN